MDKIVNIALIQYVIKDSWQYNMDRVEDLLKQAADRGADLAVLPEIFNMPYDMTLVPERAESIPGGPTCEKLSHWAKSYGLVLVGGSMAEVDADGRYYNTSTLWDSNGDLLTCHRKVHLFDVDLPGGVSFKESSILSPGEKVTVAPVLGMKIGIAVCYDVRFPEIFRLMTLKGADFVALPGAFNNVSGPNHWEILLRNRAMENTIYVAGVSGLAPEDSGYHSWGHSMLVDPFAEVLVNMGRAEGIAMGKIDPERIRDIRARLPMLKQRREDLYKLEIIETTGGAE